MLQSRASHYLIAAGGIAGVTASLVALRTRINSTTVALAMLLVVLFVAALWGSRPAMFASVLGMLCFNFFFLPPIGTLTIADPDNWVALAAFLITAATAGQLSARAKRRAEEAEVRRGEIERLYEELRTAFERASHTEALRQSEKLKSALLNAVTHDIRTPLTSIKASVTTLLDEREGRDFDGERITLGAEARREMLEVIDEETDRLNRFVEGLIELARIEAGEVRLRRRWGAVDEIITATLQRAAMLTGKHHIKIAIEKELPIVRVDPRAVAEVVYTLIDNATKYSPSGTTITITARQISDLIVEITVEDEGAGVSAELREKVFDKFFRALRVEDAGGGRGARFLFTLPIGDTDEAGETMDGSERRDK